jgi:hypothetical protein
MYRTIMAVLLLTATLAGGCGKGPWNRKSKVDPYEAVQVGMTEADVVKLMGAPSRRMVIPLEGTDQRQVLLRWLTRNHLIHVSLVNDQVIGKERT